MVNEKHLRWKTRSYDTSHSPRGAIPMYTHIYIQRVSVCVHIEREKALYRNARYIYIYIYIELMRKARGGGGGGESALDSCRACLHG